jgi:hypothetical protein
MRISAVKETTATALIGHLLSQHSSESYYAATSAHVIQTIKNKLLKIGTL